MQRAKEWKSMLILMRINGCGNGGGGEGAHPEGRCHGDGDHGGAGAGPRRGKPGPGRRLWRARKHSQRVVQATLTSLPPNRFLKKARGWRVEIGDLAREGSCNLRGAPLTWDSLHARIPPHSSNVLKSVWEL